MASAIDWWTARFASFAWRFTVLFTGILLLLISAIIFVLYQLSIGEISRSKQQQLNLIAQQQQLLAGQLQYSEFLQQLSLQAEQSRDWIIAYQDSEVALGDLSRVPSHLQGCPDLSSFLVAQGDDLRVYSGCIVTLAQGTLLVAFDEEDLYFLQQRFINASLVSLLLTIILGGFSGRYLSKQLLRRIKRFNQAAAVVQGGNWSARVPSTGRGDEFDLLASNINRMLTQLEHSFQAVSGVTDAIAHDLRTPLGRLRLALESAITQTPQEPITAATLEPMLKELDDILHTFSSMLELSRLEHKQARSSFQEVDLQQIADDAIELLQPIAQDRQQSILLDASGVTTIEGDRSLIFRALFNTLENASKYGGNGATLKLSLNAMGFTVADNGPGIATEFHDKVFQRLYRLESSRTTPGYGLGLPLVKAIAEFHGGDVELSNLSPGLTVTVRFRKDRSISANGRETVGTTAAFD